MILLSLILALAIVNHGALSSPLYSSSVYLQRANSVPALEYVEYAPAALSVPSGQYARLVAQGPLVPTQYSGLTPCIAPCVYEVAVAPSPDAKVVAYQAPVTKLSIEQNKQTNPYEYSYVIYDENTGDQKAQKELSDGGVVRGQYSLLQPNGYVREVQYTADDTNGFNAVVKNFLPTKPDQKAEMKEQKLTESVPATVTEDVNAKETGKDAGTPEVTTGDPVVVASTETTTDMTTEKTESKKYVLTYEDLINCAQTLFDNNPDKQSNQPGSMDQVPHGTYGVPADEPGHEGHGHPGRPHGTAISNKPAKKSPLTYIILPSIGTGKPC